LAKLEPGSRQLIAVARRYGFNAEIRGQVRNNLHCAVMAKKIKKAASLKLQAA